MVFIYFVIFIFLIFTIKYFIEYSLSTATKRSQTIKAAILCVYFLPVFILSLLLFYASIINFPFFCLKFFKSFLFLALIKAGYLFSMSYFFLVGLLISFLFWLAKKTAYTDFSFVGFIYKLVYLIISFFIVKYIWLNIDYLYQVNFMKSETMDSEKISLAIITILILILSFVKKIRKSSYELVVYSKMSIKIVSAYFILLFIVAALGLALKCMAFIVDNIIS
jgi:hypothetical protein